MSAERTSNPTPLFHLYGAAVRLIAPLALRKVVSKLRSYGVAENRLSERKGVASLPRPTGRLIWFHAASVGESLSILTLVNHLGAQDDTLEFLITSGTPTSAELIEQRMPPRCRHQFPPLDTPAFVQRFLDHWQPDLAVLVESELWPNLIVQTRATGCPLVLLNARLSAKSVAGWQKRPRTAEFLLSQFTLFLTQNQTTADNLKAIGAPDARIKPGSNLKALAAPPPVNPELVEQVRTALNGRPAWVASSTHKGEEEIILAAHDQLLYSHPDLCLILVPRHPERGDAVEALIAEANQNYNRRSRGALPQPDAKIYLADTLGETGSWYALCPRVFLGGSLQKIGGHNPFEPAHHGCAVTTGPGYFNFAETFDEMIADGAASKIKNAETLARQIDLWLRDEVALKQAQTAARAFISRQSDLLEQTADLLLEQLQHEET
ncbi:3-deoxy-D-manno-octulosonic acid transferase [Epibacterium sp. SM1969]|uniref:3-deoxy-D-manno-octulosonic acid transferase n=1 Tax=Tritonibacter aquimaris TaxID=2663379 RepID=A0A844AV37_9RHOB|nr:3-deoxy-D-manno-octulosonic acid transferase [Tritonibacter aquimaris]MQY41076.1 3-deoxy-D-manno-octulosonic acid transferase [Tritonibacter aquimaris]